MVLVAGSLNEMDDVAYSSPWKRLKVSETRKGWIISKFGGTYFKAVADPGGGGRLACKK